ncbi:MAG: BrnA antitoxin family protein [Deltaproteobacteria bacterium]|nr:BrnA antitoxin family protein [Deltaproteobacteria bacterium]
MKEPNWKNLKINRQATQQLRHRMAKAGKTKITINVDADVLASARQLAAKQGSPYQTYLNWLLRQVLSEKETEGSRLDRLEKELVQIKKKLAA